MSQEKSKDKLIREKTFKRDKDFNEKIKEQMQQQEKMLTNYFKEYKKPVSQDPSIMKRSQDGQMRKAMFKEVLAPFQVFNKYYDQYWNRQCETQQERFVLEQCKSVALAQYQYTKKQIAKCLFFSLACTSVVSFSMRMRLGPRFHLFGLFVGTSVGLLYGITSSSQHTMQRFQALGQTYSSSRSTIRETQKLRMDKKF